MIVGDFHTHTLVSQHAYSTINELVTGCRESGLHAIAITDHGPQMLDGAISHHFLCMTSLPEYIQGCRVYTGAEVNIKDFHGKLDLADKILRKLDFVIASYHVEAIDPGTATDNTDGWIAAIHNQFVDCIGHPGNPVFPFDHEAVVRELAATGKLLEVNSNSFVVRPGSEPNCRHLVSLCMEHGVPVIVNSDAHNMWQVGAVSEALGMLKDMEVPPSMIINTSLTNVDGYIQKRKLAKLST